MQLLVEHEATVPSKSFDFNMILSYVPAYFPEATNYLKGGLND